MQRLQPARASVAVEKGTDLRVWNDKARAARTTHLEVSQCSRPARHRRHLLFTGSDTATLHKSRNTCWGLAGKPRPCQNTQRIVAGTKVWQRAGRTHQAAAQSAVREGAWQQSSVVCSVVHGGRARRQEQAMAVLQAAVDNFERPAFPCALILGDVVILDLLHRLDLLASGRVPIIFVDTFHLFPETHQLLRKLEVRAR